MGYKNSHFEKMKVTKTYKFKLRLNSTQSDSIDRMVSHCRYLYNIAKECREWSYKSYGKTLNYYDLANELPMKWTKQEELTLRKDYQIEPNIGVICEKYNRTWGAIRYKAKSMMLSRPRFKHKRVIKNKHIVTTIELMYLDGCNIREISKKLGLHQRDVSFALKAVNKKTQSELKRKYPIDETFFDIINTQEKAYTLGLLYADGYNNTDRNSVNLSLKESDKEILEKDNFNHSTYETIAVFKYKLHEKKERF